MDVKNSITESLAKLQEHAIQRDALEEQMGKLHLAVRALCNLVDDKAEREGYKAMLERFPVRIGVSDLVRQCFYTFDAPLTPVQIRNFIQNYGSEAGMQPNLLQSVHTILGRMEDSGRIKGTANDDGEKAYRLVKFGERLAAFEPEKKTVKSLEEVEKNLASKRPMSPKMQALYDALLAGAKKR